MDHFLNFHCELAKKYCYEKIFYFIRIEASLSFFGNDCDRFEKAYFNRCGKDNRWAIVFFTFFGIRSRKYKFRFHPHLFISSLFHSILFINKRKSANGRKSRAVCAARRDLNFL